MEARLRFEGEGVAIDERVTRAELEGWIGEELAAIAECVDGLIARASVDPDDVGSVFLTGGSSFVPAVRRIFAERFGAERLHGGAELTSVASGLALCAMDADG